MEIKFYIYVFQMKNLVSHVSNINITYIYVSMIYELKTQVYIIIKLIEDL